MGKINLRGKWVLVTGASSGLGRQIVEQLARREGANLILAARRLHLLREIREKIIRGYQVSVEVIDIDLRQEGNARELFSRATRDHPVFAVVNNAGMTSYQPTSLENLSIYRDIFRLNYHSLMELTLRFYRYFRERGEGAILNVTSAAAFMPIPYQNVYAASKHAAQAFTEGLIAENKHRGVHISTFAPGGIATDMIRQAGLDKKYRINSIYYMTPRTVARRAIKCLKFKRHIKIPGTGNKIVYFLTRLFPRRWVVQVASYFYKHPDIS